MAFCAVPHCKASGQDVNVRLYGLPEDPEKRVQWLQLIGIEDMGSDIFICDKHFEERMFYPSLEGIKRLAPEAIPSLFLDKEVVVESSNIEKTGDMINLAKLKQERNDSDEESCNQDDFPNESTDSPTPNEKDSVSKEAEMDCQKCDKLYQSQKFHFICKLCQSIFSFEDMLDHFVSDDSLKVKCELDIEENIDVDADDEAGKVLYPVINIKMDDDNDEPLSPSETMNMKREPKFEDIDDFDVNFDDVFQNDYFDEDFTKPESGHRKKRKRRAIQPGKI